MKKTKNQSKSGFVLMSLAIFLIIISLDFIFAQEEKNPAVPVTYTPSALEYDPAPQWVIDKVNNYIISYVGKDYFEEHIKLITNYTLDETGRAKYGESYVFVYNYTHNLKEKPDSAPYPVVYQFQLRADPDGELVTIKDVKYTGPNRPYKFLISRQEAVEIALEFGLKRPFFKTGGNEAYIYYGYQGYGRADTLVKDGTFGWEISSYYCTSGMRVEAVWVDVDTGDIITTKSVESACQGEELDSTNGSTQTGSISKDNSIKETNYNGEIKDRIDDFNKKRHPSIPQRIINWIKSLFM